MARMGVDLSSMTHAMIAASDRPSFPAPETGARAEMRPLPDVPFLMWADYDAGEFRMDDPLVVGPDGSTVDCPNPGKLNQGDTYYCVIRCADGGYTASVETQPAPASADGSPVWNVELFTVPVGSFDDVKRNGGDGKFVQKHMGAIVLPPLPSAAPAVPELDGRSVDFVPSSEPTEEDPYPEDTDTVEIKGWKYQDAQADTTLVEEIGLGKDDGHTTDIEVLVRKGRDNPAMAYLNIGRALGPGDGTITVKQGNAVLGSFSVNQVSDQTILIPAPPAPPVPNDGALRVKKPGESSFTSVFTANQSGNTDLDLSSLGGLPVVGNAPTALGDDQDIAAMRYDKDSTHSLQVKVRGLNIQNNRIVSVTPVSDWLTVTNGTAVAHSTEV